MSTKYVVIRNPTWDESSTVEANGPQQAIRKASNGDEATYLAVPLRNLTVIRAAVPPHPPVPALTFDEADTAAWLASHVSASPLEYPADADVGSESGR